MKSVAVRSYVAAASSTSWMAAFLLRQPVTLDHLSFSSDLYVSKKCWISTLTCSPMSVGGPAGSCVHASPFQCGGGADPNETSIGEVHDAAMPWSIELPNDVWQCLFLGPLLKIAKGVLFWGVVPFYFCCKIRSEKRVPAGESKTSQSCIVKIVKAARFLAVGGKFLENAKLNQ